MGVIKQGILGGFSGKVGSVIGTSWKGIAVMKSRPLSVANPKTAGQVAQRGAMTQIVIVARLLLAAVLQPLWNPFAQKMSGYNSLVKENIATFATAGFTDLLISFSQRGSLINFAGISATAVNASNEITVNWTDNSGTADALAADTSNVVYYNATQDYWGTAMAGAARSAATVVITDSVMATNDLLKIYVGAARVNISKVSDSQYLAVTAS